VGVWKVPGETKGQATLEGNHDPCEQHPPGRYLPMKKNIQRGGGGGLGAIKTAKATAGEGNVSN